MANSIDKSASNERAINALIVGDSQAIKNVRNMVKLAADTEATVLITGPSGCGKEVIAKSLHQASSRSAKPFVAVNCGAIPRELIESELFGHEKGSFTGATSRRLGHFEQAHAGTLFLDEIGDMPMDMQVRLLRVLEERKIRRVGGNQEIAINTRIVAATHQNLEEAIANGTFREDLYYRLSVLPIETSPLRERPVDVPVLINHFMKMADNLAAPTFSKKAMAALCAHSWAGNVRELRNVVDRANIFFAGSEIDTEQLSVLLGRNFRQKTINVAAEAVRKTSVTTMSKEKTTFSTASEPKVDASGFDIRQHLICEERNIIQQALIQTNGTISKAAELLSLPRTTFIEKMRRLDLEMA